MTGSRTNDTALATGNSVPDGLPQRSNGENLIARIEAASVGTAELDEAIGEFVGYVCAGMSSGRRTWFRPHGSYIGLMDSFTTSIDAAMWLVPEDFRYQVNCEMTLSVADRKTKEFYKAADGTQKRFRGKWCHWFVLNDHIQSPRAKEYTGSHDEPAMALCIAALKARVALDAPQDTEGRVP